MVVAPPVSVSLPGFDSAFELRFGVSLATAYATNSLGAEIGRVEAGWDTDLAAVEFRSLVPKTALLETLARKTGGEVIGQGKLEEFVRELSSRKGGRRYELQS